jgi:hypothetical protein
MGGSSETVIMTHKFFYRKNLPNDKIKPKPTIQRINIPPESLERSILISSSKILTHRREKLIDTMSGYCCICGNTATYIAKYTMSDATLIEKYCDFCILKIA